MTDHKKKAPMARSGVLKKKLSVTLFCKADLTRVSMVIGRGNIATGSRSKGERLDSTGDPTRTNEGLNQGAGWGQCMENS